jgi:hypothetical protein
MRVTRQYSALFKNSDLKFSQKDQKSISEAFDKALDFSQEHMENASNRENSRTVCKNLETFYKKQGNLNLADKYMNKKSSFKAMSD